MIRKLFVLLLLLGSHFCFGGECPLIRKDLLQGYVGRQKYISKEARIECHELLGDIRTQGKIHPDDLALAINNQRVTPEQVDETLEALAFFRKNSDGGKISGLTDIPEGNNQAHIQRLKTDNPQVIGNWYEPVAVERVIKDGQLKTVFKTDQPIKIKSMGQGWQTSGGSSFQNDVGLVAGTKKIALDAKHGSAKDDATRLLEQLEKAQDVIEKSSHPDKPTHFCFVTDDGWVPPEVRKKIDELNGRVPEIQRPVYEVLVGGGY